MSISNSQCRPMPPVRWAGTVYPLKIAAKIGKVDRDDFETRLKPLLDHPLIEYIGEIGEREKNRFLGNAMALLFPIDWPEPFGLVMIEAMACGTPVIAYRAGSVPEVLDDGVSGFIVEGITILRSIAPRSTGSHSIWIFDPTPGEDTIIQRTD